MVKNNDFQNQVDRLRLDYLDQIPMKSQKIKEELSKFTKTNRLKNLENLFTEVHSLSGSASTFGLPQVSKTAIEAGRYIRSFTEELRSPAMIDHAKLEKLVEALLQAMGKTTTEVMTKNIDVSEDQSPLMLRATDTEQPIVYILEDEVLFGNRCCRKLESIGLECVVFKEFTAFEKAVEKRCPHLVISDIVFPEDRLGGLRVIQKLRERVKNNFHVAFMSQRTDFETRLNAHKLGIDFYFTKPMDFDHFGNSVANLLFHNQRKPFRILVIDDDIDLSAYYALALENAGMNVQQVNDPRGCIEAIEFFQPELIILDVIMPQCSGLDVAGVIRQTPIYNGIPIIFLSSEGSFDQQLAARRLGGDDFLTKPIEAKFLISSVGIRVSRARKRKELDVALNNSINEAKQAKEEALTAANHKSAFLANMSHEIRTPLNGIMGTFQLLEQVEMKDEIRELLALQKSSSDLLLTVINDILDFSKIEAGKVTLEFIETNLPDLIKSTMELFSPAAIEKGVVFSSLLARNLPQIVEADGVRVKQVLVNFISNSLKFTSNGKISLDVKVEEQTLDRVKLTFSVEDSGIGLTENQKDKLFEAFTQADTSTTRKYGGTGLGLSISQRLVQLMGGEITVASKVNWGTKFQFSLDLKCKQGDLLKPHKSLSQKKFLVVTKNPHIKDYFKRLCSSYENSCQFIDRLEFSIDGFGHGFDIVVYDVFWSEDLSLEAFNYLEASGVKQEIKICLGESTNLPRENLKVTKPRLAFHDFLERTQVHSPKKENSDKPALENLDAKVLVAEDNRVNQVLAMKFLHLLGCDVVMVENGEEAVEKVVEQEFDLVFMDCQMPVLDGYEATRKIRSLGGRYADIPIIAMTAHVVEGEVERCLESGMNAHLPKPVNLKKLSSLAASFLSSQQGDSMSHILDFKQIKQLKEIGEGDTNFIDEMLDGFSTTIPKYLEKLKLADKVNVHEEVEFFAHKIKGTASNLGVKQLALIAQEIEAKARLKQSIDNIDSLIQDIERAYAEGEQSLHQFFKKSA